MLKDHKTAVSTLVSAVNSKFKIAHYVESGLRPDSTCTGRWAAIRLLTAFVTKTLLLLIVLIQLTTIAGAAAPRIEELNVSVECPQAPTAARVAKRMEASVNTVGQHVLLGKTVDEVLSAQSSYEKIIKEIFDRVLVGYSVNTVAITPGKATTVYVKLVPWGDVVRKVTLKINFSGVSPAVLPHLKDDIGDLERQIKEILLGLPVDSVDWVSGVAKQMIRETLAEKLPEFTATFDIEPGKETVLRVSLVPAGATIKDVNVNLRSQLLPNIMLFRARNQALETAKNLRGLPVAYVKRHEDIFGGMIRDVIANHKIARDYHLQVSADMVVDTDTTVTINANTDKYKVILEGYLDIGKDEDNTSLRLHAGKYIGDHDEIFLEINFMPSNVEWEFVPGWGTRLGPSTIGGIKYNLSESKSILWINQNLGPKWSLRIERIPADHHNEFALRYKMHEFLGVEYVASDTDNYLRLIGNL